MTGRGRSDYSTDAGSTAVGDESTYNSAYQSESQQSSELVRLFYAINGLILPSDARIWGKHFRPRRHIGGLLDAKFPQLKLSLTH